MMKKTKGIYRVILVALLSISSFLLIAFAVLPSVLSSSWGKDNILVPLVNKTIPGKVSFEKIHLSWFGDQSLQGIQLRDPNGIIVLTIDSLKTDTSLWSLLHSPPHLGKLEIENLNATLLQDEKNISNLERSLYSNSRSASFQENVLLSGLKEIAFIHVNARLTLPSLSSPLIAHFDGETSQNNQSGHFNIDTTIQGIMLTHDFWRLPYTIPYLFIGNSKPEVKLKAEVTNLPVAILDQLATFAYPEARGVIIAALGERLDLTLNQSESKDGMLLKLNVKSANLQGNFYGRYKEGFLELVEPGRLSLEMTPPLAAALNNSILPFPLLKEIQKSRADLSFNHFRIPLKNLTLPMLDFHVYLTVPRFELIDGTIFKDSTAEFLSSEKNPNFQAIVHSLIVSEQQNGNISFNAQIPFSELNFVPTEQNYFPNNIEARFESQGISTKTFSQLFGNPIIVDLLGDWIAFDGNIKTQSNSAEIETKISSKRLSIPKLHIKLDESVTLLEPTAISYQLTPQLFQRLILAESKPQLRQDVPVKIAIDKLAFPIDESKRDNLPTIIQATIKAEPVAISNLPVIEDLEINALHWNISALSLDNIENNLIAEMVQPLISDIIHLDIHAKASLKPEGQLDINNFNALISNLGHSELRINGEALGLWNANPQVNNKNLLTAKGSFNYPITPKMLEHLGLTRNGASRISSPLLTSVIVDNLEVPLNANFLTEMKASAKVNVDSITFTNSENGKLGSLQNLVSNISVDGPENKITGNLEAQTKSPINEDLGILKVAASLSNWRLSEGQDLCHMCVNASGEVKHLPITIIETIFDFDNLDILIGPSLDLQFTLNTLGSEDSSGLINLNIQGSQFQANADLKMDQTISLRDPSNPILIDWTLSPERFAEIRKKLLSAGVGKRDLALNSASSVIAKISDFSLPWKSALEKPGSPRWIHSAATVNLSLDKVSITDRKKKRTTLLDAVSAKLSTHDLAQALVFEWNTKGYSEHESHPSELKFRGVVDNLLTPKGKINTQQFSIGVDATAAKAPIVLLCDLFCLGDEMINQVDVLIGDHLDANVHMQLTNFNGPLNFALKGSQGQFSLDGQLENGLLTLNTPLTAKISVNSKLSQSILQDLVPFMSTAVNSDQPISVKIDPKGFVFPLYSWNIQKISFDNVVVDFGRIYFSYDMQIAQILSLLNFTPYSSSDLISIWFTPLHASMKNGVISCDRMDMLAAGKYAIAIWGNVDFVQDKVNMMVGLNGETLREAFGVKGVPQHAMLQLPLRGTTSDASLDKTKATAKVSAMVASHQGTPHGAILGGILDILTGTFGEKPPPEPTTQPFPWELERQ